MRYKYLRFFNSKGDPIGSEYNQDEQHWELSIYIKETATRIFEVETIHIVEEVEVSGDNVLNYPFSESGDSLVTYKWVNNTPEISFIEVDNILKDEPTMKKVELVTHLFGDQSGYTIGVDDIKVSPIAKPIAARVDICVHATEEEEYERILEITDGDDNLIAKILVYGVVEGRDERLDELQAFLPKQITHNQEFIFRDSDINEDLPDHRLLNKRKKAFLSYERDLLPYISSIRSVIGFIRYFGYNDIRLKEYWRNVDTDKLLLREIVLDEQDKLTDPNNIPKYPYVRIPELGLFYDIVRISTDGSITDEGLPETEKAFAYSLKEVLVKLFGLKEYLENENITGTAKIRDIIGEYQFFEKTDINAWKDQSNKLSMDFNIEPSFIVEPDFTYLEDLRPELNTYECSLPVEWTVGENGSDKVVDNQTCWIGYFAPFYRDAPQFPDEANIPVGKIVTLKNTSFGVCWAEVLASWKDTANNNLTITWKNLEFLNYYEVEWVVTTAKAHKSTQQPFEYRKRGKVTDVSIVDVNIPFFGVYDVVIILHGFNNEVSRKTVFNALDIRPLEVEFTAFYRIYEFELQNWNTNYLSWKQLWSQWRAPIYDTERYKIGDSEVKYSSLSTVRYVDLEFSEVEGVGLGDRVWSDYFGATWKDYKYMSWKQSRFERERLAYFFIDKLSPNGEIQVGESVYTMPNNANKNEWIRIANELNELDDDDINSYYYVARPFDKPVYIEAVAKDPDDLGEKWVGADNGAELNAGIITWKSLKSKWKSVPLQWAKADSGFRTKSIKNPFSADNIKVFTRNFQAPTLIPVLFVIDNCKIAGKTAGYWTITDEFNNKLVDSVKSLYFAYTFEKEGYYNISVAIEDTNGNLVENSWEKRIKISNTIDFAKEFYQEEAELMQL